MMLATGIGVDEIEQKRMSFDRSERIYLKGTVLADDLELGLEQYYKRNSIGPLLFDFTDARYIEIAVLVNCIATAVQRINTGHKTFIAYPKDKAVRDFLQVWRFPEAVLDATKKELSHFLLAEDHKYLCEEQTTYTGRGDGVDALEYNPDWSGQKEYQRNFFEFLTFFSEDRSAISPKGQFEFAPRRLSRRWAEPSILEVLGKHLAGDSPREEIARVVIFEAMSNAVRHPGASVIQVVSKFDRKSLETTSSTSELGLLSQRSTESRNSALLRICIWDDGEAIHKTLLAALNEGRPVQAFRLPIFMCDRVFVDLRDFEEKTKDKSIVDQSHPITLNNATEERLLLSSLFPGVSRTISKDVPQVKRFDESIQGSGNLGTNLALAPGMGLYALTRTVLDQFQGKLFIRSGSCRLLIEVAHDAYRKANNARYKCKITTYPHWFPPFQGNLLTMQLPLRTST